MLTTWLMLSVFNCIKLVNNMISFAFSVWYTTTSFVINECVAIYILMNNEMELCCVFVSSKYDSCSTAITWQYFARHIYTYLIRMSKYCSVCDVTMKPKTGDKKYIVDVESPPGEKDARCVHRDVMVWKRFSHYCLFVGVFDWWRASKESVL